MNTPGNTQSQSTEDSKVSSGLKALFGDTRESDDTEHALHQALDATTHGSRDGYPQDWTRTACNP